MRMKMIWMCFCRYLIQNLIEINLSLFINSNLNFEDHIDYILSKTSKSVGILYGSQTFHPFCGSPPVGSPHYKKKIHPYGWFTSRMIHPSDGFTPGRFTLRTFHHQDVLPPGRFIPRTFHPPDISPPGKFTPRNVHPFGIFLIFKVH